MRRFRHLKSEWTEDDIRYLAEKGFSIEWKFESIRLPENSLYFELRKHFADRRISESFSDTYTYEYTKKEVLSSEYCMLRYIHSFGYPVYEDKFLIYDQSKHCHTCDMDKVQIEDYRMESLPTRYKFSMWQFISGPEETVFVYEDFYKHVLEPLGIQCRTVKMKSGKIRPGVVQLILPIIDEELDLSLHEYEVCPSCGRKRYSLKWNYPFFPLHKHPLPHIYLSKEQFGTGAASSRKIFISTELAKQLMELKQITLRSLIPCTRDMSVAKRELEITTLMDSCGLIES